jgi:hypothetical protein
MTECASPLSCLRERARERAASEASVDDLRMRSGRFATAPSLPTSLPLAGERGDP